MFTAPFDATFPDKCSFSWKAPGHENCIFCKICTIVTWWFSYCYVFVDVPTESPEEDRISRRNVGIKKKLQVFEFVSDCLAEKQPKGMNNESNL